MIIIFKKQKVMSFKKAKVVMLPTNDKSLGVIVKHKHVNPNLLTTNINEDFIGNNNKYQAYHLYITSDDKIKESDYIHTTNIPIEKVKEIIKDYSTQKGYESLYICENGNQYKPCEVYGKIIATTDTSLNLPQPSKEFIEKYVEEYNKGNVIEDVLVEYEMNIPKEATKFPEFKVETVRCVWEDDYRLKIDKNNTITIKKVKYTLKELCSKDPKLKEEIEQLLHLALITGSAYEKEMTPDMIRAWIKNHL